MPPCYALNGCPPFRVYQYYPPHHVFVGHMGVFLFEWAELEQQDKPQRGMLSPDSLTVISKVASPVTKAQGIHLRTIQWMMTPYVILIWYIEMNSVAVHLGLSSFPPSLSVANSFPSLTDTSGYRWETQHRVLHYIISTWLEGNTALLICSRFCQNAVSVEKWWRHEINDSSAGCGEIWWQTPFTDVYCRRQQTKLFYRFRSCLFTFARLSLPSILFILVFIFHSSLSPIRYSS